MLVPETIGDLWKQRIRWAQGGQEVLIRDWKHGLRAINIPLFTLIIEQTLSLIWVYWIVGALCWMILHINFLDIYYLEYQFTLILLPALVLTFINVLQFTVSLLIDSRYEKLAAQCISRHCSITESIASKERSICNMDKSGTSKRRIAHLGLNLLREGVILIFSLGFWLYCLIAFILFVGTMVRSHSPSVLLTRVTLNLEANDIEQLLRTMLLFSIIAIVIFTTCYIIQRFVCGKRGY